MRLIEELNTRNAINMKRTSAYNNKEQSEAGRWQWGNQGMKSLRVRHNTE